MIDECLTVVVCRGLYPIILTEIATSLILGIAQHRVSWTREFKKNIVPVKDPSESLWSCLDLNVSLITYLAKCKSLMFVFRVEFLIFTKIDIFISLHSMP